MNLNKVKLVIVDMDGTLLNSKHEVSTLFFELYIKLKSLNVQFVVASGRPYYSIVEKLDKLKDEIIIASENGAYVLEKHKIILSKPIEYNTAELIKIVDNLQHVHPVYCTANKAYLQEKSKPLIDIIAQYYTNYEFIDTTKDIEKELFKIALYHETDSEKCIYPHVKHLESNYKVIVSAKNWVDISHIDANKGFALQLIQESYGITTDETMAFGDYNNDIEMLQLATFSYAMENAHKDVKAVANYVTTSNDDNGVENILKQLIKAKQANI
ncbi:HAD family hydrolase [Lacinutrix chionoecetis]